METAYYHSLGEKVHIIISSTAISRSCERWDLGAGVIHYALFKINSRQPKILQMDLAGFRLAVESRFGEVVSNRD
jgi:hypothetical protein